ncbi:MAG: glycosyltransferase [Opitutaceae bacterium]
MKLLQVMLAPGDGGAETFFEKLAIAFQRAGIQQQLIICRHPARRERLEAAGCDVVEIAAKGWRKWLAKSAVKNIAKSFQPTVQLAWMSRAAGALSVLPGCFNVARLGGYYPLKYYKTCDFLVGNTPGVLEYLKQAGWPRDKMGLISNFGSIPDAGVSVNHQTIRESFELSKDVPVILTLGRLHVNKAQDVLIKAMAKVPEAVLLLAGDGELRGELEALAESNGVTERIRFLGWRRDIDALFYAADICAFPSRAEPLGNVVLEAWSHNVPIAAAASEGPSWLIEHEQTGLLFPIDDVEACAQSIQRLLTDTPLRNRLVKQGGEKLNASFSEAAIVGRFQELFTDGSID